MQVASGPVHSDLDRADAAQRVGQRGMLEVRHAGVGNDDGVAAERGAAFLEKGREVFAADFLLAFDDEGEVARQFSPRPQVGLDRFKVGEMLTLVVAGAAGEVGAVGDARIEGFGFPELERLGRLHVVMAINEIMWSTAGGTGWGAGGLRADDRVATRWAEARGQADALAMPNG